MNVYFLIQGGDNLAIAKDCQSPPWEAGKGGWWECNPPNPPHKVCILRCAKEDDDISEDFAGTYLGFSCDESSDKPWNVTQIEKCDDETGINRYY